MPAFALYLIAHFLVAAIGLCTVSVETQAKSPSAPRKVVRATHTVPSRAHPKTSKPRIQAALNKSYSPRNTTKKQRLNAQRAQTRKVMFVPPTSLGRSFGLHKTPDELALHSSVAYVMDQNTLEPLFEKNIHAVLPIASLTKLMTAIVTLDAYLPLNERLTITREDIDFEKKTGSRLPIGSNLSRQDMLHIALMSSENRAAAALSRHYPGGRAAFIEAMNNKAFALGMRDTYFSDSTGLSSHNVSNAHDLAKLVNAAHQYPLIRQFSTDPSHIISTGQKTLLYHNTNVLTHRLTWNIGVQKTGFTYDAGECLVMQTTLENRPLIIVLLDAFGKYSRISDAQRIRHWLSTQPHLINSSYFSENDRYFELTH